MSDVTLVPSITTHSRRGSTWREKIAEIEPLGLQEVGLFVTGLMKAERKECYRLLLSIKEHHYFTIPFVHAVSDMEETEYAFLRYEFGTRWFNLHPEREFPIIKPLSEDTKSVISIENSCFVDLITREDLKGFGGLCIDLSHLEDTRRTNPDGFKHIVELCHEFPVRANHISAIINPASQIHRGAPQHSSHYLASIQEMDYVQTMPKEVIGEIAAIELENSLRDQLRAVSSIRDSLHSLSFATKKLAA